MGALHESYGIVHRLSAFYRRITLMTSMQIQMWNGVQVVRVKISAETADICCEFCYGRAAILVCCQMLHVNDDFAAL